MPTLVRERFLSFSREFILGSRVASNLLVREMGKITHLSCLLGFFPQATLPSCRRSLNLMALPPWSSRRIRVAGQRATREPVVNSTLFMVALRLRASPMNAVFIDLSFRKPVLPPYHKRGMAPYAFPAKLGPSFTGQTKSGDEIRPDLGGEPILRRPWCRGHQGRQLSPTVKIDDWAFLL